MEDAEFRRRRSNDCVMLHTKAEVDQAYADGIEQCAKWHESRAHEIGWDFVEGRAHRLHAEELRRLKP